MQRGNYYEDSPDIQFHLKERVNWQRLFQLAPKDEVEALGCSSWQEYRDTWLEVISGVGEICANTLAPNAKEVEEEKMELLDNGDVTYGPKLTENLDVFKENGLTGLGQKIKYGGLGGPFIIELVIGEMVARACPSTFLNIVWYSPIAHIIEQFGDEKTKDLYIPKIVTGEYSGNMALTEPDAGSDLASVRSYGEKAEDGTWKIFGNKRFISNGCGDISLCLAKSSKESKGLKSLSLFLVPRKVDGKSNYQVTKLEEKIGLHGSATCELQFDGSEGVLLGKEGEGFLYMLRLMNDARISVGLQGLGIMDGAKRLAEQYASERKTWGKPIAEHELIAEKLLDMDVEQKAFRSLCIQASYYRSLTYLIEKYVAENDSISNAEKKSLEKELASAKSLVRKWTPLIKWYVGEKSVEHCRSGLLIHGGYGFSTEYRAEWWVRESLILAIYEGTSQIQALMCVKDTMKDIIRKPSEFVESYFGLKVKGLTESDDMRKQLYRLKRTFSGSLVAILLTMIKGNISSKLSDVKKTDIPKMLKTLSKELVKFEKLRPALLHSERICEIKSLVAMANCVVRDAESHPDRKWIADRFFYRSVPRCDSLKAEIESFDSVIHERLDSFEAK